MPEDQLSQDLHRQMLNEIFCAFIVHFFSLFLGSCANVTILRLLVELGVLLPTDAKELLRRITKLDDGLVRFFQV